MVSALLRGTEPEWIRCMEWCWQTTAKKRPSFSTLQQDKAFTVSNGSRTYNSDGGLSEHALTSALKQQRQVKQAVERGVETRTPSGSSTAVPVQSETAVTVWLSTIGLGRVAMDVAACDAYCDMEVFEDMVGSNELQASFAKAIGLSPHERQLLRDGVSALVQDGGQGRAHPEVASRPASPSPVRTGAE